MKQILRFTAITVTILIFSKPSICQTVAIQNDKLNILYIGTQNALSIATSEGRDDKVTVSIEGGGGTITKNGNGKYNVIVSTVTDSCNIKVFVKNKLIGVTKYRTSLIPAPEVYLARRQSGADIPKVEFRAQGGFFVGILNFPLKLDYTVVSYTFTLNKGDSRIISINVLGAAFNEEVRNAINQHVEPGTIVTFEDIKVKGPDGKIRTVPEALYYIK
jgi:hypothetical protein